MPFSTHRWSVLILGALGYSLQGCSLTETRDVLPEATSSLSLAPVVKLLDDTAAILARPGQVSIDPVGRYVVSDPSDKNIKIYGANGDRVLTIGRPGKGPGEFTALSSAEAFRDSILAFDFSGARFSVFANDGRYARSFELGRDVTRPWTVRAVDDSLLLLVAPPLRAHQGNLLTLVRRDGSVVSSFFNMSRYFGRDPKLIQNTGLVADARDGRVFASLVGGDSLYAFDYAGRQLGAYPADPQVPLVTVKTLLGRNHGRARRPDGSWVTDGNRNVIRLVALDRSTVALQIVRYDAERGIDPLEGGTLETFTLDDAGNVAAHGRAELAAGLVGRDSRGSALLMGYAGAAADAYVLSRLVVGDTGAARGRGR